MKSMRVMSALVPLMAAAALLVMIGASGATASSYLSMVYSPEVTDGLAGFEVPAGYTYYYIGTSSMPEAVLGLRSDYRLRSQLWREVEMTDRNVKIMVGHFNREVCTAEVQGFTLLDAGGEAVGVWLSDVLQGRARVVGEKEISITVPTRHTIAIGGEGV